MGDNETASKSGRNTANVICQDDSQSSMLNSTQNLSRSSGKNDYVYLDYAATSPLREEVLEAMLAYMKGGREGASFSMNPNSLHTPGRNAFKALEDARRQIARSLDVSRPSQIFFTSGATESDNTALSGISRAAAKERSNSGESAHIIVSSIEHDAIISCAKHLKRDGFEVTYLDPNRDGFIESSDFEKAIKPNTVMASIQLANSEIGSIQAVKQLADIAHSHGVYFHTDATQALGKTEVHIDDLDVDAASFSAHKIGGPRGTGILFLKNKVPFEPLLYGGGQESSMRSGTQDVACAVGFAVACNIAVEEMEKERERLGALRDKLYGDLSSFDRIQTTVEVEPESLDYLCNIVNFMILGVESETSVIRFDSLGFGVSGGSACASSSLDASHVLLSMGIKEDEALGEVRVSMGRDTTRDDINRFLAAVTKVIDWKY